MTIAIRHRSDAEVTLKPLDFLGSERFQDYRAAIQGSQYDPTKKQNVVPIANLSVILRRLREMGFDVDVEPRVATLLAGYEATTWADYQSARERVRAVGEERLYDYQQTGVAWLATRQTGLLADDPGLGKTVQTLMSLPAGARVLVVAPSVAKGVWQRETKKWRPLLRTTVLEGRGSFRWPEAGEVVILNYDILPPAHAPSCAAKKDCRGCAAHLTSCPAEVTIVADEAHALKSAKAKRTEAFRTLGRVARAKGGRTWLLTGTPLLNRPEELWGVLASGGMAQEAFGDFKTFLRLFNANPGKWGGYVYGMPSSEVPARLKRVCLRREKRDVLTELPDKTWENLVVSIDKSTLKLCDDFLKKHGGADKVADLLAENSFDFETMSAIRAALASAKAASLTALVEEYEAQDAPLIVFSAHRAPIDMLATREGWAVITGDTPDHERSRIEQAFQKGQYKGVAGTIKAAGVAITLTRASHCIFVDKEWTPELNRQAEDRIHRIGQTKGCLYTTLIADHVLDARIHEVLTAKERLIGITVGAAVTRRTETPGYAHGDAPPPARVDAEGFISVEHGGAQRIPVGTGRHAELVARLRALEPREVSAKELRASLLAQLDRHHALYPSAWEMVESLVDVPPPPRKTR